MIETVWDLTTTAAVYHYMWLFNRVKNRSQLCYFDRVQMNMLQQRMLSKLYYSSRLQWMTLFHSPLEQKRHQISSQGSRHVRARAVVFCSPESTPTVMSKNLTMFMSCAVGRIYVHVHVASCATSRRKSWHSGRPTESNAILTFVVAKTGNQML
jgi:hypothetical protein